VVLQARPGRLVLVEVLVLGRAVGEVERVVVARLGHVPPGAPGRVEPADQVAPVERVVAVHVLVGLLVGGDPGIDGPPVPLPLQPDAGRTVDVHRRVEGQPPQPVHRDAEVVVVEHVRRLPGGHRVHRRGRDEVGRQRRQGDPMGALAEEPLVVPGAVHVVGVDGDGLRARHRRAAGACGPGEHAVDQGPPGDGQRPGADVGDQPARPDALVDEVAQLAAVGGGDAGVVQRDDLPLVVEHQRARRARLGVGRVVEVVVEHVDDAVVAQRDLLPLAPRVLDDRDEVAHDGLALGLDEAVAPEPGQVARGGAHRHQRVVEALVGQEQALRVEAELRRGERPPVEAVLVVELDDAARRDLGVREDVVVGEQQLGRHHRARAVAHHPVQPVADADPGDGPAGDHARLQVADGDEVLGADDPLEDGAGGRHRRGVPGPQAGRVDRPDVGVGAAQPVDPRADALGGVGVGEAMFRCERADPAPPDLGPLRHPDGHRVRVLVRGDDASYGHVRLLGPTWSDQSGLRGERGPGGSVRYARQAAPPPTAANG
jgi:hypothetical protein